MNIKNLLNKNNRIFIIPLDHTVESDTPRLISLGKQNFVNLIDNLNHDGYIFHSREYLINPIKTNKDFFLTVGELPDNYLCNINDLEKVPSKNVTIFFEVEDLFDTKPYEFYKDYVKELKEKGYFVMAMGYPIEGNKNLKTYSHVINIAHQLGCDAIKTDFVNFFDKLDLKGMKLSIAGGQFIPKDEDFEIFVKNVKNLKIASCSFGRNIFESENYKKRINFVSSLK